VSGEAGLTALDFDLPHGALPLRNRPRLRASTSLVADLLPNARATVVASWSGRVFDSSIPTGSAYLSSYLLVDAAVSWTVRNAQVTLAIDNVLNRGYQQFIGFAGTERRGRIEVSWNI
jgi:outer membrane cobalamin receptor